MDERLRDIGEFGLIARVVARLGSTADVVVGPGDDAAVVTAADGRVVATTDLLVEGRHFRWDWSSAYDVGHKAAAQNLADVVAMGARPTALLVGLAAPPDWLVADAEAFADGLRDEASVAGAAVVGGDVVGAASVVVSVTALGSLDGRPPVTRGGARAGDIVLLVGHAGWSALGLGLLARGDSGLLSRHQDAVAAHRRPLPPYAGALALAAAGWPSAMIDVSDGVLADAGHVAAASGVALDLWSTALCDDRSRAVAADLGVDPLAAALGGGEDHAFLVTGPAGVAWPVGPARADDPRGLWVRQVGTVGEGSGVTVDGQAWTGGAGWDHFAGGTS